VTVDDAATALEVDRRVAAKVLARWAEQGWLKRLRRGTYSPIPPDALSADRTLTNPWVLVPELFSPGYVGGWSAAEHWGLTEQIFREVCVFTIRPFRSKRAVFEDVAFILNRTHERNLFGLSTLWEGSVRILVSDPHRTLVDMLDRPAVGGGIRHVDDCLRAYLASADADLPKLMGYADRLANGAVYKRLGFLLEKIDPKAERIVQACRKRLTSGYSKLDPALVSEANLRRWRLRLPASWVASRND
jgi:predicted transcriptional regulator of viral defense system